MCNICQVLAVNPHKTKVSHSHPHPSLMTQRRLISPFLQRPHPIFYKAKVEFSQDSDFIFEEIDTAPTDPDKARAPCRTKCPTLILNHEPSCNPNLNPNPNPSVDLNIDPETDFRSIKVAGGLWKHLMCDKIKIFCICSRGVLP